MDDEAVATLIERVYDMALDPALWPELLGELAQVFGAHAAGLEQEHAESERGAGLTVGLDPGVVRTYFEYYAACNVLRRFDGFADRIGTFTPIITVDEECLPKRDLVRSEFYADFLRPAGIHSTLTLGLWAQAQSITAISLYRPVARPNFDGAEVRLAETLHPHLIRAFRLSRQMGRSRQLGDGFAALIDRAAFGAVILSSEGAVLHANTAAQEAFAGGALRLAAGRLACSDVAANERLGAAIARALGRLGVRAGGTVSAPRRGKSPLTLTIAPFGAERLVPFAAEPGAIVCITDADTAMGVTEAQLRDIHGLTAAEARVAGALLKGRSLTVIAEEFGVSPFTVKAQLKRVCEKTGVNRQAELVALLARTAASQAFS